MHVVVGAGGGAKRRDGGGFEGGARVPLAAPVGVQGVDRVEAGANERDGAGEADLRGFEPDR